MNRTETSFYPTAAVSHPGMSGKNNEDRFAVSAYRVENDAPSLFAVLCDGIGGHRAGEIAAEMAVNIISQDVGRSDASDPCAIMSEAIVDASSRINLAAQQDNGRYGMGATCVCAWIIDWRLYGAAVGDSRMYLLRDRQLIRLTKDHTWIQEALDAGMITPTEANGHPNAHVIRRYLGSLHPPEVDLRLRLNEEESDELAVANQGLPLLSGDRLLLCSDGLTDLVKDDEIAQMLADASMETALQRLVNQANARGGHDNITLVAIQVPPQPKPVRAKKRTPLGCAAAIAAVTLLLAALVIGGLWLRGRDVLKTATPTPNLAIEGTLPVLPPTVENGPQIATLAAPTRSVLPTQAPWVPDLLENGATLTPWPTNTRPADGLTNTPTPAAQ